MRSRRSSRIPAVAGWTVIFLLSNLLAYSLGSTTGAQASTALAAPTGLPELVSLSTDELYDLAIEAEAQARKGYDNNYTPPYQTDSRWTEAMIYLSAYMGRLPESEANSQATSTLQSHLSRLKDHIDQRFALGNDAWRDRKITAPCLSEAGVRWRFTYAAPPAALPKRSPASSSARTRAPEILFSDEFNGPSLNRVFEEGLPDAAFRPNTNAFAIYEGAPSYSFDTWSGGAQYLRIFSSLNDKQRRGWRTADVYKPGDRAFRLELRFNPRTQSRERGIDQLLEVWLIDAGSQHKHIRVIVFSDGYGANRLFAYTNTLISKGEERSFSFEDNKWYRLVITGSPNENIKAAIFDDSETRELVSLVTSSRSSAFPNGFRLGLSQSVGYPGGKFPTDVGIDWIRLVAK